ncbi:MAG: DUF427 domain-containing protein [Ktedonobacterales bacterium]|nr:DUF427 domain-containing protein [Ktedonobacterales bacterium]
MPRPQPTPPGPGQESVWDYPRPPRVEESAKLVQVLLNGVMLAETRHAKRVLETSSPPVYYLPPEDVKLTYVRRTDRTTLCEWKGVARYFTLTVGDVTVVNGAWCYPDPHPAYAAIRDYIAFYPGKMEACLLDGERARAQPGDYYGGWITAAIVGPFKGDPGTEGW